MTQFYIFFFFRLRVSIFSKVIYTINPFNKYFSSLTLVRGAHKRQKSKENHELKMVWNHWPISDIRSFLHRLKLFKPFCEWDGSNFTHSQKNKAWCLNILIIILKLIIEPYSNVLSLSRHKSRNFGGEGISQLHRPQCGAGT